MPAKDLDHRRRVDRLPGRIVAGLNRAGFRDLRLPHMGVLQYPGPDACRPSELAERAGMSKQAMNQLLQSLERLGYVSRRESKADRRARLGNIPRHERASVRMVLPCNAFWPRI